MKILAILGVLVFPPLGVIINGDSAGQLLLNIVLTLLGWIPGLIHALYLILSSPERLR